MAGSEEDGNALQRNKGSRNLCGQDLALLWVFPAARLFSRTTTANKTVVYRATACLSPGCRSICL